MTEARAEPLLARRVRGGVPQPAVRFPTGRVVVEHVGVINILEPGDDRGWLLDPPPEFEDHEPPSVGVAVRSEDESGVSGTGVVADVAVFPSGKVVQEWRNADNPLLDCDDGGVDVRPDLGAWVAIHGHGGRTRLEFDEKPWLDGFSSSASG